MERMWTYMKKFITIIVCSISFLVLSTCVSKKKLILPEAKTISVISLQKKITEDIKTINKREEISKLIEKIQEQSRSTTLESSNDQPTNVKDYIIIKFTHQNEENDSVVYLYTRKEKRYIEQPYVGIWQLNPDIANRIEEFFSSWFIEYKKSLGSFLVSNYWKSNLYHVLNGKSRRFAVFIYLNSYEDWKKISF